MCLIKECIKFIVFIFNFLFVLVGAALITIGIIFQLKFDNVTNAFPDEYKFQLIPILTIVVGSIIFVISLFGCCGALRQSPCLLSTYAVILLVIFILQVALGVFALLELKNEADLKHEIDRRINNVFEKTDNVSVEVRDFIQSELHCCGTYGPGYWNSNVPKSCLDSRSIPYTTGCQKTFFDFLKNSIQVIGIVLLTLTATEIVGAILSLCLANSIKNEHRRSGYY